MSLALAAGLPAAAHASAIGTATDPWVAVSGVFVGPDGLRIGPVVAAGVVVALVFISIVARLARKPTPAAQTAGAARPAPAAKLAASRPASGRPEPQRPAAALAQTSKAAAAKPAAAPTSKSQASKPQASKSSVSTSNITAVKATPLIRVIRKLPPELDLKHRDPASRTGAIAPAVKLVSERRGVIAHVEKMKVSEESDLAKRRPTRFLRGRRTA